MLNDIMECIEDLRLIFSKFDELSEARQHCLIDMRFNLGPGGFRSFKRMIGAVEAGDFEAAAIQMQDSKWFSQVGRRAARLVEMMVS